MARKTIGSQALLNSLVARKDLVDSTTLADFLRTQKDAEASVQVGGTNYAIIDVVVAPEGIVLLTDKDDKPMKASSIVKDLGESEGLAVFLDVEGQLIPAKTLTKDGVQAKSDCDKEELTSSQVLADLDVNQIKASLGRIANKESWFDPKDQGMGNAATLWGPSSHPEQEQCYISYDSHNDELQVGVVDEDFTPEPIYDGSLKDMRKAFEHANVKGKATFDSKAEKEFKKFLTKVLTGSAEVEATEEAPIQATESEAEAEVKSSKQSGAGFSRKLEATFTEMDQSFSGSTTLYGAPDAENSEKYNGVVFAYDGQEDYLSFETIDEDFTPDVVLSGSYKNLSKYLKLALKMGFQFSSKSAKQFIESVKRQFEARTKAYAAEAVQEAPLRANIIANKDNSKALARFKLWAKMNKLSVETLELTDTMLSVTVSDLGDVTKEAINDALEDSVASHKKSATVEVEESEEEFIAFSIEF